ncbi:MAG: hypothetical protein KDA32_04120 [Phycisphaerales bacterium]|nr:hypothetical protein [Phycisphaerales bacterium]
MLGSNSPPTSTPVPPPYAESNRTSTPSSPLLPRQQALRRRPVTDIELTAPTLSCCNPLA